MAEELYRKQALGERQLSVALVSRSNAQGGGASRIAEELAEWLTVRGHQVVHYCAVPMGPLRSFQAPLFASDVIGKVTRATRRLTRRFGLNEFVPAEYYTTLRLALENVDVVHFHDLNSEISPLTMRLCSRKRPVIFTAHDCSCFTGGCIYPLKCEGFLKTCGMCPQLDSMGSRCDLTSAKLKMNRRIAKRAGVHYVFPSHWLRATASHSLEFGEEALVIPNGFSSDAYEFRPKTEARRELGIAGKQRIIVVAAHFLGDPRKGVSFALAAICSVADLAPLVIFIGHAPNDLEVRLPGIQFWLTGFVSNRARLGLIFAAADLFLFTSLEDNLPIMVQEALASGTPVVGFAAGGVAEMVEHGRTGLLCAPGNQSDLNQTLREALVRGDLDAFGEAARSTFQERYDVDVFGTRHLALYEEAMN